MPARHMDRSARKHGTSCTNERPSHRQYRHEYRANNTLLLLINGSQRISPSRWCNTHLKVLDFLGPTGAIQHLDVDTSPHSKYPLISLAACNQRRAVPPYSFVYRHEIAALPRCVWHGVYLHPDLRQVFWYCFRYPPEGHIDADCADGFVDGDKGGHYLISCKMEQGASDAQRQSGKQGRPSKRQAMQLRA